MRVVDVLTEINEAGIGLVYYAKCSCGAITITAGRRDFSFMPDVDANYAILQERYGLDKQINDNYSSCNHCGNNWGLDLCACGSGEDYRTCKEGFDSCGQPSQIIGG